MKERTKENITGLIVLTVYLLAIFLVVEFTKPKPALTDNDGDEQSVQSLQSHSPISKTSYLPKPMLLDILDSKDSEITTVPEFTEPSEKPVLVAERLYGKELYIFYIAQIVEQYYPDVDPYIALAVLEAESDYNPKTYSSAGAVGLMQVIPKYHAWRVEKYGLNDLWDPYTNIICGMDFLNESYLKYGDWFTTLLRYNNSTIYVKYVLNKADILRKDGYFG